MDPEELWGNPAAHFDLDGDPGTGDGGFETTRPAITDIATATFTAVGSRTVRGKAVDHLGLASGVESMTVSAAGAPTCYALTDLGVLFPKRMIEHSADTVNGKIYIFSGYSPDPPNRPTDGHVYDPSTNSFSVTTPGMQNGREAAEVLAIGTKVYVVGGAGMFVGLCTSYVNTTDIYDTITGTWAPGATLNPNLWRCAGVAHNGRIWLPGGFRQWDEFSCGSYVNSVNTTTIYNPTTNAWSNLNDFGVPVPAFAERRWGHGAAVLNGKLTIFPGYYETSGGAQGTVRTVNEYDLSQAGATWMVKDQAPGFRDLYELEVVNNRAYLIGGESAGTSYSQVWQYDPTKPSGQQWTTLNTACGGSPLPTLYSYAAAVYNGEIYLFGGQNSFGVYTRACYKLTLG